MDAVFETDAGIFNYRVAGVWIIDNHVLLHKSVYEENWALPGGRVKIKEESTTGLRREFQEELDIDVEVNKLLWTTENFFTYEGKPFQEIAFYYLVSASSDYEIKLDAFYGNETDKPLVYKWVPVANLDTLSLQPAFLKSGIKEIPIHSEHKIIIDV